jgi:L-iditol 2-dehydrogenase
VVFGAGAIGQMVSQVAKSQGATVIVAGLPQDKERFKLALAAGADRCVDQMEEDIKAVVMEMTDNVGADKCFECSGAVPALNKALEIVKRKGTVVQMGVFNNTHETIWTDLILHREIVYVGSRSQKPSSWVTALELMKNGTVVPEKIATYLTPLENWREGFEKMMAGEVTKGIIVLDDTLK